MLNDNVTKGLLPQYFDHLLTEKFEISEAPEPTDIIWENRHYTDEERSNKSCIVGIIIFILLLISAGFIFSFSVKSKQLKEKYPITDC